MTNFIKIVKNSVKNWYLLTISGIIFVVLGIWVFTTPLESYLTLSILFSISFLVTGIGECIYAISNRKEIEGWGWNLASAILGILLGIVLIIYPEISIIILPIVVAFVTMYKSVFAIASSFELKRYGIMDWGNLLALGILGLILSFMLLAHPVFTGFSLVYLTGSTFIIIGIYGIYYSVKLKKINKKASNIGDELKDKWENVQNEIKETISK